jgi:UDP-N-acetylmuramoyl-L-alanyl-D-glutamate--2,6-diaminopimelate ligase
MVNRTTLGEVAARVGGRVIGDETTPITGVTHDSRAVETGSLFIAVRGEHADGHDFVDQAIAAGAAAVCVEVETTGRVPSVMVADTRAAMGPVAAVVYGDPSGALTLIGVTGTNGKTTVTHLLESIIRFAGLRPAVIGTVGARVGETDVAVERTTPEATDFQRILADMVESAVDVAAVEVSSHALDLGRVDAAVFTVAAFTNLSQDHLDFHGDMEAYYRAKASLFVPERAHRAVVWVDDPAGRRLASETDIPVTTVGTGPDDDIRVDWLELSLRGSLFTVIGPGGAASPVRLRLAGDFNVANALIAAGCASAVGIDWPDIAAGIEAVEQVPGRFEFVDVGGDVAIVVDYAHTPDGVGSVIRTSRALIGDGRVLVVVGAGGDRDRAKRPLMGRAAADADLAFITSDNPRSEDPAGIIGDVLTGTGGGRARVVADPDRRSAIHAAIGEAHPGDLVLILGKGHEQGQEFDGFTVPFDDRVVAREEAAAT